MAHEHPSWSDDVYQGPVADVGQWKVAYRRQKPSPDVEPSGQTFVFGHGQKFNRNIWATTGILDYLNRAGHEAVAIDLPGGRNYEITRTTGLPATDPTAFWEKTMGVLGIERPIGVFHSMSGKEFAYNMAGARPDLLSGIVMVAPIHARKLISQSDLPALVVWGERDEVITPDKADLVASNFSNVTVALFDGAGHAPFVDNPEGFAQLLDKFGRDPATAHARLGDVSVRGTNLFAA